MTGRSIQRLLAGPRRFGALTWVALWAGCSAPGDTAERTPQVEAGEDSAAVPVHGRTYERSVVFFDASQDSARLVVAWDFENRSEPGGVYRNIRGWLARAGEWNQFMEDDWTTEPSRAPWRILPRASARIVVGEEDALGSISFQEGLRDLETVLGPTIREWRGRHGEIYRLSSGTAFLSGEPTEGFVLDLATARLTETEPATEWAVLIGDELQVVIADEPGPGPSRAWARRDFQDLAWSELEVEWTESTSFERARRDVPVVWTMSSADQGFSAELRAIGSHLQTLQGEGPRLPVLGVYEVEGYVEIDGERSDVKGFLHHAQLDD